MTISIDAVFENGALRPLQPLTLAEHERVRILIEPIDNWVRRTQGVVHCTESQLIERAALDHELEYVSEHP